MSALRSFPVQLVSDLKVFVRNPAAGGDYGDIRISTLQVPAFIALAVVSASFVSLAMGLTNVRENGVLKRVRATPAAPGIVFAGRIGTAIMSALIVTAILCAIGGLVFGVTLPTTTLPALLVTLIVGAGAFCALGIAYTRLIPNDDAAPAMTNAVVLPLYFVSGVFVPVSQLPDGLRRVAGVLPVQPFVDALTVTFDPRTVGSGFAVGDLLIIAAWGVAGLVL